MDRQNYKPSLSLVVIFLVLTIILVIGKIVFTQVDIIDILSFVGVTVFLMWTYYFYGQEIDLPKESRKTPLYQRMIAVIVFLLVVPVFEKGLTFAGYTISSYIFNLFYDLLLMLVVVFSGGILGHRNKIILQEEDS